MVFQRKSKKVRLLLRRTQVRVFKCALAYWLGSLATFWVPFTKFLGKSDGIHLVATVTVYFHPARTIGSTCSSLLSS